MQLTGPEQRLKMLIGDLHFQVAILSAKLEEVTASVAPKIDEPVKTEEPPKEDKG